LKNFIELGLSAKLLKAISDLGFETPTTIQEKTIPAILQSKQDIIALAQTGTGKTAGFGLPVIQQIIPENHFVQTLILCPTRELCLQITRDMQNFSKYLENISIVAVYGGADIDQQVRSIKKGAQIIVGTPGRTLDLLKRKTLKINNINCLILDEADEMLNMGFREDLDEILGKTPAEKQILLFSATMPDGVRRIATNYMNNPVEILSGKKNSGAENVVHYCYFVKAHERYTAFKRLVDLHPAIYGLVFCRTRSDTKELADKLTHDGYNADALHGDLSQAQRDHVMKRFRSRHLQLLIATDVAARGLDIIDLTHVINYTLPDDPEIYLHRSGRTGRAGKTGISIIIAGSRDERKIRELEKTVSKKFQIKSVPSGKEICEKRLYNLIDKIENITINESRIDPYLDMICKKLEWLDREELLKRFVSVEFTRFSDYFNDAIDINAGREEKREEKVVWEKTTPQKKFSRFFINIGSKQNIKAANLIGLINENTRKRDILIGKIEIQRNFSFFEIEKKYEDLILNAFQNRYFGSFKIIVQLSRPETNTGGRRSIRERIVKESR
jgi:ATP-dependent RNA helicase DeaD